MSKQRTYRPAADRRLVLDYYHGEWGEIVWCWKDLETDEASQEFDSEEAAIAGMREERLIWGHLSDLGD